MVVGDGVVVVGGGGVGRWWVAGIAMGGDG